MSRLIAVALLAGCGGAAPDPVWLPCSDITDVCGLPAPSSTFERLDSTTASGLRVELSTDADFAGLKAELDRRPADGWSPVGAITTWLPQAVSVPSGWDASLDPESPIALLDADGPDPGARHPFRAEVVAADRGALLLLMPLRPLRHGGRYVVVVDRSIAAPTAAMTEALGGRGPRGALARDLLRQARGAGFERADIGQVWDFHVRTEVDALTESAALRDALDGWLAANPPRLVVGEAQDSGSGWRRFGLTLEAPRWHEGRDGPLRLDGGLGTQTLTGTLIISAAASASTPALPVVFGHGLGVDVETMLPTLADLARVGGPVALVAFDQDVHGTRGRGQPDVEQIVADRNVQAFVAVLLQSASDAVCALEGAAALELPGEPGLIRQGAPYYLGQSLGSFVGTAAAALRPAARGYALNVAGGAMATVLRAGMVRGLLDLDERLAGPIADAPPVGLPDELAVDLLLALAQNGLDPADPAVLAPQARDGGAPLLQQISIGDGIVVRDASELLARAWSLPLLTPSEPVPGLEEVASPTCGEPASAVARWETSEVPFVAHLALDDDRVQAQVIRWFTSLEAGVGDVSYGRPGEPGCP